MPRVLDSWSERYFIFGSLIMKVTLTCDGNLEMSRSYCRIPPGAHGELTYIETDELPADAAAYFRKIKI